MPHAKIAVIGGSGLYKIDGLTDIEDVGNTRTGVLRLPLSHRGSKATARRLTVLLYHI
ncbi:MAG: hypothetical protein OEZ00_01415 [Dehalococcoidia bacterium]|nr:hypothetical protein [Dehalococcoidia bacterium]